MNIYIPISSEFLNLSWMKTDKEIRAPNILKVSQRFNEVSVSNLELEKPLEAIELNHTFLPFNSIYFPPNARLPHMMKVLPLCKT